MKKINSRQATHDDELPNAQVKYVYSKRDENDALHCNFDTFCGESSPMALLA